MSARFFEKMQVGLSGFVNHSTAGSHRRRSGSAFSLRRRSGLGGGGTRKRKPPIVLFWRIAASKIQLVVRKVNNHIAHRLWDDTEFASSG